MLPSAAWGLALFGLAGAPTYQKADLERLSTAQLAAALLPPDRAEGVRSHKLVSGLFPGGNYTAVEFISVPWKIAANFCATSRYFVSLRPASGTSESSLTTDSPAISANVLMSNQIALASDCATARNYAHLNSGDLTTGMELLNYLAELREKARKSAEISVKVDCATDLADDYCKEGAIARLANLPIEQVSIIDRPSRLEGRGWKWRVSIPEVVSSVGPSAEVNLDAGPECASRVEIRRKIPAPF